MAMVWVMGVRSDGGFWPVQAFADQADAVRARLLAEAAGTSTVEFYELPMFPEVSPVPWFSRKPQIPYEVP